MSATDFLLNELETSKEFVRRHIGPSDLDIQTMLKDFGCSSLDELTDKVVPAEIRVKKSLKLGEGLSEHETLNELKKILGIGHTQDRARNKPFKSYIGAGYYDTITPTVILRNIFENPGWYTAYTPYQAEISQGRLEALLNFQTMIVELTGLDIANASLLDEATAAAEAMVMAHNLCKNQKVIHFLVSPKLHPQTLEVLATRAEPLGLKMIVQDPQTFDWSVPVFGVFIQYPDTEGEITDWTGLVQKAHEHQALVAVAADILSLALLKPPGEWGADIALGSTQRFGVPMGFGGPHAAYMATRDGFKRSLPGRIIGVSVDKHENKGLRLALQTREQHIRREKASSNICTAQVLLANMAGMYAVYHGPEGIKKIAGRVHRLTQILSLGLKKLGYSIENKFYFDTLKVGCKGVSASDLLKIAEKNGINLRNLSNSGSGSSSSSGATFGISFVGISLDETTTIEDVYTLWKVFEQTLNTSTVGLPHLMEYASKNLAGPETSMPPGMARQSSPLSHPIFSAHHSETEMLRYIHQLQSKDISLIHSMIPLGSCTMKLNATTELLPVSWPEINGLHPFAPAEQTIGILEMIHQLENMLCEITGFAGVSLQPNAGSQGEYAGLLVIGKYHKSCGQGHRNICLIPSSAHGTNPASAAMAGLKIVVVNCDDKGNVDLEDLRKKATEHKDNLNSLMITYPSTHGVFEASIAEVCKIIHDNGGLVYMDGANMNAQVGLSRPGDFGADVCHLNLHKTFAIPHGGGGPGVGPIGVTSKLKEFLPTHSVIPSCGPKTGISAVSAAPWGSASVLPISWSYIRMMGGQGLKKATQVAILNANYIAKKLEGAFPILYKGQNGMVAHECILDLRPLKKTSGIDVTDLAKRLMDFGFHAPTMSFPVPGTLMIEPTESEPKAELDRFIAAMLKIRQEIADVESGKTSLQDNPLVNSPHTLHEVCGEQWSHSYSRQEAAFPLLWVAANKIWPAVGRVDNAYGDKNLMCSCPPIEEYSAIAEKPSIAKNPSIKVHS